MEKDLEARWQTIQLIQPNKPIYQVFKNNKGKSFTEEIVFFALQKCIKTGTYWDILGETRVVSLTLGDLAQQYHGFSEDQEFFDGYSDEPYENEKWVNS